MAQRAVTSGLTPRQARGTVLYELGVRFPGGNTDDRRTSDLDHLEQMGILAIDLVEAGDRIAHTRIVSTYPPLALLLEKCAEAKRDRLTAENRRVDEGPGREARRMTADELVQCADILRLGKAGLYWCVTCAEYKPFCGPHVDDAGREARAHESAAACAAMDSGALKPPRKPLGQHATRDFVPLADVIPLDRGPF